MLKVLFVLALFAVATYLVVRAAQQRGLTTPPQLRRPTLPRRPTRPRVVAPDDDEDFLRDLDRKRLNPPDGD